jgi:hypothetical protein
MAIPRLCSIEVCKDADPTFKITFCRGNARGKGEAIVVNVMVQKSVTLSIEAAGAGYCAAEVEAIKALKAI